MLCDVAYAQEQGAGERTKEVFAQQGEELGVGKELGQLAAAFAEGRMAEHDQLLSTVFSAAFRTEQLRAFPRNGAAGARCQENLGKWFTQ